MAPTLSSVLVAGAAAAASALSSAEAFPVSGSPTAQKEAALRAQFEAWATTHNRPYAANSNLLGADMEKEHRFGVYRDNVAFVEGIVAHGINGTWNAGIDGPFMDRTHAEFAAQLGEYVHTPSEDAGFMHADVAVGDTAVDWSKNGAVTPIKNQGQCGSCWSFSTTGSIEGINFLATQKLVSASEQQLVSCDHNGDQGCNGGLMDQAFQYVINNGGLDTESDYPYTSGTGVAPACDSTKEKADVITIDGFQDVPVGDEDSLRKAITAQPVSVAVDATQWQYYSGGIFNGFLGVCGETLDHGVLAVGFDPSDGKHGSYKVKNSWGSTWGEEGYIRLPMNKGKDGFCGIAKSASYPTKKGVEFSHAKKESGSSSDQ